eukprot:3652749-Pyramimonas_sp.AAC.1
MWGEGRGRVQGSTFLSIYAPIIGYTQEWPWARVTFGARLCEGRGGTKHERARRYRRTALGDRGTPVGPHQRTR